MWRWPRLLLSECVSHPEPKNAISCHVQELSCIPSYVVLLCIQEGGILFICQGFYCEEHEEDLLKISRYFAICDDFSEGYRNRRKGVGYDVYSTRLIPSIRNSLLSSPLVIGNYWTVYVIVSIVPLKLTQLMSSAITPCQVGWPMNDLPPRTW